MDCGRPLKITTAFCDAATGMVNTQPKETRMCEFDGFFGRTHGVAARWMLKGDGPKMAQKGPNTAPKMAQDGPKKAPRWPKTARRKCHEQG